MGGMAGSAAEAPVKQPPVDSPDEKPASVHRPRRGYLTQRLNPSLRSRKREPEAEPEAEPEEEPEEEPEAGAGRGAGRGAGSGAGSGGGAGRGAGRGAGGGRSSRPLRRSGDESSQGRMVKRVKSRHGGGFSLLEVGVMLLFFTGITFGTLASLPFINTELRKIIVGLLSCGASETGAQKKSKGDADSSGGCYGRLCRQELILRSAGACART